MSKKKEKDLEELEYVLDEIVEDTGESAVVTFKVAPKEAVKPPQMITFDRYFTSLGRPMHHKPGMEAFCKTKGKKARPAWEALFAKY